MREGGVFDKLLELRASGQAAITSTTSETGIALPLTKSDDYVVVVNVESFDNTTGDESYLITAEVSDLVGGTYEVVGTLLSADLKAQTVPFKFELPVSGKKVSDVLSTAAFLKIKATLGGTTPILAYNAFVRRCY